MLVPLLDLFSRHGEDDESNWLVSFAGNGSPTLHSHLIGIKGGKGPADALFIDNIPIPVPGKNQALVKVKAFGLNRMDLLQREGKYPVPPQAPSTMGVEFSGIIQSFGDDAEQDFKIGDEVFGLAYGGMPQYAQSRP